MTETPRQSPHMMESPAVSLGPKDILEIQNDGRDAFRAGLSATACPWAAAHTSADVEKRRMWIRGYAQGRTDLRQSRDRPQSD